VGPEVAAAPPNGGDGGPHRRNWGRIRDFPRAGSAPRNRRHIPDVREISNTPSSSKSGVIDNARSPCPAWSVRKRHYGWSAAKKLYYQLPCRAHVVQRAGVRDRHGGIKARAAQGRTIAVIGSGDGPGPTRNQGLAEKNRLLPARLVGIPMTFTAQRQTFPIRNRIVAVGRGCWCRGGAEERVLITDIAALEHAACLCGPGQIDRRPPSDRTAHQPRRQTSDQRRGHPRDLKLSSPDPDNCLVPLSRPGLATSLQGANHPGQPWKSAETRGPVVTKSDCRCPRCGPLSRPRNEKVG